MTHQLQTCVFTAGEDQRPHNVRHALNATDARSYLERSLREHISSENKAKAGASCERIISADHNTNTDMLTCALVFRRAYLSIPLSS